MSLSDPVSILLGLATGLASGALSGVLSYVVFRERASARMDGQAKDLLTLEKRATELSDKCREQDKRIDALMLALAKREAVEEATRQQRERSRSAAGPLALPHLPRSSSE